MEIPYTVQARPDTGVYNAKVGMWLFLASEVMLFGGLFSSYILLRVSALEGTWPTGLLSVPLGTINTILLALSAITTLMAWVSCKARMFDRFKLFQGLTILLAIVFLCIKSYEYRDKLTHYEVALKSGEFADGHLVRKEANGDVVLHGHTVKDRAELMNGRKHVEHRELTIPKDQIMRMQNYGPWHNTFLAVYFTMSGLHALHIIGGIVVMAYLWGPGSRMWKTDPERFTNRVEVSGLFWHFVDLVWIFLFPTLYLI
jgi:cytochrome c oxidase subunit 3